MYKFRIKSTLTYCNQTKFLNLFKKKKKYIKYIFFNKKQLK